MALTPFLLHNIALVILFFVLLAACGIVEFLDNGGGVKKLSTLEAIKFMDQKKHVLVDLRDYVEFEKGYIRGAKNILLAHLKLKPEEHIKKKDTPILLIDHQENRAVTAASHLKKQGFEKVAVLKGGMIGWKKGNLPTVKENTEKKK